MQKKVQTSCGTVVKWYDETVEEKGSYQQDCCGVKIALYWSYVQNKEKQKGDDVSGRV